MVRVPAFQAGYAGSIPVTRSRFEVVRLDYQVQYNGVEALASGWTSEVQAGRLKR